MTIRHVIDYYMDGHCMIAFCKVCSAEGDKLLEDCPQKIENPIDDGNQPDKQELLKIQSGMFRR